MKSKFVGAIFFTQILLLWHYLFLNIRVIGEFGVALPVLVSCISLGLAVIFFRSCSSIIYIRLHFILFIILIFWIACRYLIDLGDLEAMKQITIGTTGGMLLFYLLGMLLREALNWDSKNCRLKFFIVGLSYLIYECWTLDFYFSIKRPDLFLIYDPDGSYQRPGNFMSISFIVFSYAHVKENIRQELKKNGMIFLLTSNSLYLISALVMLTCASLLGSNSAVVVTAMLTLLTMGTIFLFEKSKILMRYKKEVYFKHLVLSFFVPAIRYCLIACVTIVPVMLFFEIDLTQTRVFGFGAEENSSLTSRFEILSQWGFKQIAYAPILGNVDVAYLVTGEKGLTLHNFFPNVWASLGLLGLAITLTIFFLVCRGLYRSSFNGRIFLSAMDCSKRFIDFYGFLVVLFLLCFANISTGFSWSVLWFAVGFFFASFSVRPKLLEVNH